MAQDYIIKIEGSWPSGETEYVIGTDDPERLPVVTDSDNGDVLTVVDGKWKDAAPSGGGLPPVTSADNGDFLGVNNGEWGKVGGYSASTQIVIPQQTVTTVIEGAVTYAWADVTDVSAVTINNGDMCIVTFNGETYEVTADVNQWGNVSLGEYDGDYVFTNYPFYIEWGEGFAGIATADEETVTVKVEALAVSVSDAFASAVNSIPFSKKLTYKGYIQYTQADDITVGQFNAYKVDDNLCNMVVKDANGETLSSVPSCSLYSLFQYIIPKGDSIYDKTEDIMEPRFCFYVKSTSLTQGEVIDAGQVKVIFYMYDWA